MCAASGVRGIYTSDNLYDFVTLPSDMRFKFSFDISKWPDYFAWVQLPPNLSVDTDRIQKQAEHLQTKAAIRVASQPTLAKEISDKKKARAETDY